MSELTNQDKVSLIDTRIKNLIYNRYSLELGIIEENAVPVPNDSAIASLNEQINFINSKITALQAEKAPLAE